MEFFSMSLKQSKQHNLAYYGQSLSCEQIQKVLGINVRNYIYFSYVKKIRLRYEKEKIDIVNTILK